MSDATTSELIDMAIDARRRIRVASQYMDMSRDIVHRDAVNDRNLKDLENLIRDLRQIERVE